MSNYYYHNHSYQQDAASTGQHLYQNYGFSPSYPGGGEESYLRQLPTAPAAPYPAPPPPPLQQQPQSIGALHLHVQPAPVRVEQPPARVVYVERQPEEDPICCPVLCCACAECLCSIATSVLGYALAIIMIAAGVGLAVYFLRFFKH